MTESLSILQWCQRVQGTQDAILRALGEILAQHPDREALLRSLAFVPAAEPGEADLEMHRRLGFEEGTQSIAVYAAKALAKAETLKAGGPAH